MKTAEERAQARDQEARAVAVAAAAAVVPPTFTPAQDEAMKQLSYLKMQRDGIVADRRKVAEDSRMRVLLAHRLGIGPSMIHDLTGISRTTIHKWINPENEAPK